MTGFVDVVSHILPFSLVQLVSTNAYNAITTAIYCILIKLPFRLSFRMFVAYIFEIDLANKYNGLMSIPSWWIIKFWYDTYFF